MKGKISDEELLKALRRWLQIREAEKDDDYWSDARVELYFLLRANHARLLQFFAEVCPPLTGTYIRAYNEDVQASIVQQYLDD
jgi:hypothetical protein